MKGEEE